MSRSIGGQSRVYQKVAASAAGGRRANVLSPVNCSLTESFNKADGTLGPDLVWHVDATLTDGSYPNAATIKDSQFACDLSNGVVLAGPKRAYQAAALTTDELCSNDCYAQATISKYQLVTVPDPDDPYTLYKRSYGNCELYLRSGSVLSPDVDASFAVLTIGYIIEEPADPAHRSARITVQTPDGPYGPGGYEGSFVSFYDDPILTAGQIIRFEAQGGTYRGYLDGQLLISHTETGTYRPRGRHAGLGIAHAYDSSGLDDVRLDAFKTGNL